jgi:hypothetical protein
MTVKSKLRMTAARQLVEEEGEEAVANSKSVWRVAAALRSLDAAAAARSLTPMVESSRRGLRSGGSPSSLRASWGRVDAGDVCKSGG